MGKFFWLLIVIALVSPLYAQKEENNQARVKRLRVFGWLNAWHVSAQRPFWCRLYQSPAIEVGNQLWRRRRKIRNGERTRPRVPCSAPPPNTLHPHEFHLTREGSSSKIP